LPLLPKRFKEQEVHRPGNADLKKLPAFLASEEQQYLNRINGPPLNQAVLEERDLLKYVKEAHSA